MERWGKLRSVIEITMTGHVDQTPRSVKFADYSGMTIEELCIDLDNALLTLKELAQSPGSPA